ncbi:hypothetical protein PanWU01x14_192850 [Parasponia andersonii]|uniref:Transmembrane protein n=1 Tax=Parasponia andersonii TaxID=3476 RepID=A0A2P5C191_PARAD|nr:hypothetical protein PanWU01x14_192850 [Parasponia andersonii]
MLYQLLIMSINVVMVVVEIFLGIMVVTTTFQISKKPQLTRSRKIMKRCKKIEKVHSINHLKILSVFATDEVKDDISHLSVIRSNTLLTFTKHH